MQHSYRCQLDWGRHGVHQAADRGDILVIVDTLSFSTAVAPPSILESSYIPALLGKTLPLQRSLGAAVASPSEDGALRVVVEDYLAAGAILSYLEHKKSPEAQVCEGALEHVRDDLDSIRWACTSGRELREMGFGMDVQHAARLNT